MRSVTFPFGVWIQGWIQEPLLAFSPTNQERSVGTQPAVAAGTPFDDPPSTLLERGVRNAPSYNEGRRKGKYRCDVQAVPVMELLDPLLLEQERDSERLRSSARPVKGAPASPECRGGVGSERAVRGSVLLTGTR